MTSSESSSAGGVQLPDSTTPFPWGPAAPFFWCRRFGLIFPDVQICMFWLKTSTLEPVIIKNNNNHNNNKNTDDNKNNDNNNNDNNNNDNKNRNGDNDDKDDTDDHIINLWIVSQRDTINKATIV